MKIMEYKEIIFCDNITEYKVGEDDLEAFGSVFEEMDQPLPILTKWQGLILHIAEQKVNSDFSIIEEFDCIVISEKAKNVLLPLFDETIELLPCTTERAEVYLVNATKLIEKAISDEYSHYTATEKNGIITDVQNLVFHEDSVKNKHLFKIEELPSIVFISTTFKETCMQNGLTGLDFEDSDVIFAADYI